MDGTTTRTIREEVPVAIMRSPNVDEMSMSTRPTSDGSANIDPAVTLL